MAEVQTRKRNNELVICKLEGLIQEAKYGKLFFPLQFFMGNVIF